MFTTMKKTYIAPSICFKTVKVESMIAASILSVSEADDLGVGGTTEEEGIFSGNVKEDRGGWGDEW